MFTFLYVFNSTIDNYPDTRGEEDLTMPRKARAHSGSETYHIMLRGVNKQQIFFDEEDYHQFVQILGHYKIVSGFVLYAYCLMGNHVHLLIYVKDEPLETIFRRIGSAFVYWYNSKYQRVGHLFQDRFKSEPINTESYLMTVFRYILKNPVKAGICKSAELYPYSSCREYYYSEKGITDTEPILSKIGFDTLKSFIRQKSDDSCMDIIDYSGKRYTDRAAQELILHEFGTCSPQTGKAKERGPLNLSIRRLIHSGISIRQLSRLTGISKKIIESALK